MVNWWFGIRIGIPLRNCFPFIFGDPIGIQTTGPQTGNLPWADEFQIKQQNMKKSYLAPFCGVVPSPTNRCELPPSHTNSGFWEKNVSSPKLFLSSANKGGCSPGSGAKQKKTDLPGLQDPIIPHAAALRACNGGGWTRPALNETYALQNGRDFSPPNFFRIFFLKKNVLKPRIYILIVVRNRPFPKMCCSKPWGT